MRSTSATGSADRNGSSIDCRALAPDLAVSRRPRARWRTRLVEPTATCAGSGHRSSVGRPGFAPGSGGRRAMACHPPRATAAALADRRRPRCGRASSGGDGCLASAGECAGSAAPRRPRRGRARRADRTARPRSRAGVDGRRLGRRRSRGDVLRVPEVARWWPHTHGTPAPLCRPRVVIGRWRRVDDRRRARRLPLHRRGSRPRPRHRAATGWTSTSTATRIFARGAVWTPIDPVGFGETSDDVRRSLEHRPRPPA